MFAIAFAPSDALPPAAAIAELRTVVGAAKSAAGLLADGDAEGHAHGTIDANGQFMWPNPDPKGAPRLARDPSGVADRCAALVRRVTVPLGWKIERTYVTKEARWGVVYRADSATPEDRPLRTRYMCWMKTGGHPGLMIVTHPFDMLDRRQSLGPLPAE
jgi:hypothetical protein